MWPDAIICRKSADKFNMDVDMATKKCHFQP